MITLSQELQSLLNNRLPYLPPRVGEAINSIDWPSKIIAIGHTFGMHVDEMEDFQAVVLKSMIGLIPPDRFENELVSALALSPANTEKIISEINAQIFEPIHDYVMNNSSPDQLQQSGIHLEQENRNSSLVPAATRGLSNPVHSIEFGATVPLSVKEEPASTTTEPYFEDYFSQ